MLPRIGALHPAPAQAVLETSTLPSITVLNTLRPDCFTLPIEDSLELSANISKASQNRN